MALKQIENPEGVIRPDGWTDEEWSEYLEWHYSLPKISDDPSVNRAIMVGQIKTKVDKKGRD